MRLLEVPGGMMVGSESVTVRVGERTLTAQPHLDKAQRCCMTGGPLIRLVQDDGAWFERGDRVSLQRTLSSPSEARAVKDVDGPYEVLGCSRLPVGSTRLLRLVRRAIEPE